MNDTPNETEILRKQLIFRSWHRGTREMDLLMGSFADRHVPDFDESELAQYADILQIGDPDLYDWISGRADVPANLRNPVMDILIRHRFKEKA